MRSRFASSCVFGGPALLVFGLAASNWLGGTPSPERLLLAIAGATLLVAAGLLSARWPRATRWLAATAVVLGISGPELIAAPLAAFFAGLVVLYMVDQTRAPTLDATGFTFDLRIALLGMSPWAVIRMTEVSQSPWLIGGGLAGLALTTGGMWIRPAGTRNDRSLTRWVPPSAWVVATVLAVATRQPTLAGDIVWCTLAVLIVIRGPVLYHRALLSLLTPVLNHPARLLVATFLVLCSFGAILLALPVASGGEDAVSVVDAAFTSVSASCITGLVVVDTVDAYSTVGKVVIIILIQAGALGIMTFSTAAVRLLGRRLSMRHEAALAGLLSGESRGDLFLALRRTMAVTVAFEAVGTVLLAAAFAAGGEDVAASLWRGGFTAISAICNAGFALQSDSLIPYQSNAAVLHVIAFLVVAGGLSPFVIAVLPNLARRRRVPLQVKVIIAATVLLLVGGFALTTAFDWSDGLAGLSWDDKLHNAWFQSVTTRTAGFNSIDLGQSSSAAVGLMMVLMLIGGSPGGTAGGIKTTSFWVLLAVVRAAVRGRAEPTTFGRRIPAATIYRATAIATIAGLAVAAGTILLAATQDLGLDTLAFEAVSALGTVGLSLGATTTLDGVGKVIVMALMFLGRVGPLTIFLLLSDPRESSRPEFPEEGIEVG